MIVFKVELIGFRDTLGRFARRGDELRIAQREEARTQARATLAIIKHYAPRKSGQYADGLRTRTTETADGTFLTIYASGPHAWLHDLLVGGTVAHEIPRGGSVAQMAKGYPLSFYWERGPGGPGLYHFWSVWHPGTDPDPFMALAMEAMSPQFDQSLARVAKRVAYLI